MMWPGVSSYIDDKRIIMSDRKSWRFNFVTSAIFPLKSNASSSMELLTPVLQYLSSGTCQENLVKATTGFEGISNRCRIVHKRRVFLVNTPLGGNSSSHWRLKTLQIINFSCFSQVHDAKVKIVEFDLILLLERHKEHNSRQNY